MTVVPLMVNSLTGVLVVVAVVLVETDNHLLHLLVELAKQAQLLEAL
jgi:hypothetical protein